MEYKDKYLLSFYLGDKVDINLDREDKKILESPNLRKSCDINDPECDAYGS